MAKIGSLCCVAARPHGSNMPNKNLSVESHKPYWRTNISFSPAPLRWDFGFQYEALSFGSCDGVQLASSASSNSRGRGSQMSKFLTPPPQHLISNSVVPYFGPSDVTPDQQWTPPSNIRNRRDDYDTSRRDVVLRQLSLSPTMERTFVARDRGDSTSFQANSSHDYGSMFKSHYRNFSSRRSYMSKAIHPFSFPLETPAREAAFVALARLSEFDAITLYLNIYIVQVLLVVLF
ncbi:uncharacterized protein LOC111403334 [Olea europaea var. sylvestris]|uniref:uncharacterized protein LOC111403334 n=1 Tax=Olea europaea var. sylvestris TaxID=158386 RepID=UPI000C1D7631|nr:uncharacterized protein LOC111403334 [Olea europaea var. sylvestris]